MLRTLGTIISYFLLSFIVTTVAILLVSAHAQAQAPCIDEAANVQAAAAWSEATGKRVDVRTLRGDDFEKFLDVMIAFSGEAPPAAWGEVSSAVIVRTEDNTMTFVFFTDGCEVGYTQGAGVPRFDPFFSATPKPINLFDYLPGKRSDA